MISFLAVPLMSKDKFSDLSGIDKSGVDRLIKMGVLPEIQLSERKTVVNLALLTKECLAKAQREADLNNAIKFNRGVKK